MSTGELDKAELYRIQQSIFSADGIAEDDRDKLDGLPRGERYRIAKDGLYAYLHRLQRENQDEPIYLEAEKRLDMFMDAFEDLNGKIGLEGGVDLLMRLLRETR